MLLYCLLVISVDTRMFELGILRMLGMKRKTIINIIFTQALSYSIPSYILGMICAQILAYFILNNMGLSSNLNIDSKLTQESIIIASIVGLIIPLIASILPIFNAFAYNLQQSLDLRHNQTKAVEFSIERSEDSNFNCLVFGVGVVLVLFGFIIYYFMYVKLKMFFVLFFFFFWIV